MASNFDQHGQSVEHQANIFKIRYPVKPLTITLCLVLIAALCLLAYVVKHYYDRNWEFSSNVFKDTNAGVENFGIQVNAIEQAFVKCEDIYGNGTIVFSLELGQCRDNLLNKLTSAQAVRDKYASAIDVFYLDLIDKIITQIDQDFRGINLDLWLVKSFEEEVTRRFVQSCERKKEGLEYYKEWNAMLDDSLQNCTQ